MSEFDNSSFGIRKRQQNKEDQGKHFIIKINQIISFCLIITVCQDHNHQKNHKVII